MPKRLPDALTIAQNIFAAGGGSDSRLQQPTQAYLGNPELGQGSSPYLPEDRREYVGQVWIYEGVGAYPEPDSADTQRDDAQYSIQTALLPKDKIPSTLVRYGTPVWVERISGRQTITGLAGIEAAEYLFGISDNDDRDNADLDGVLRATSPPSDGFEITEDLYEVNGTLYYAATKVISGIIATYTSDLTANQARAVLVLLDPSDNSITYTSGDPFNDTYYDAASGVNDHYGAFANYPATNPNTDKFHKGWIKFRFGMTEIGPADILPIPNGDTSRSSGAIVSDLSDLSDVDSAAQTSGYVLASSGSNYAGRALANSDLPTVDETKGGTGQTSITTGDVLYGSASDTLSKLSIGTEDQVLTVSAGGVPEWADASGGGGGGTLDGGSARDTSGLITQSADNSSITLEFDTEDRDSSSYVTLGTNADRITIPSGEGGTFLITWHVRLKITETTPTASFFGATGTLYANQGGPPVFLMRDDSEHSRESDTCEDYIGVGGSHVFALSAGDYVYIDAVWDTGVNDEVTCWPTLSVTKLS